MRRNVKSHFSAKQGALASDSRLGWVASSNHQLTERPDYTFCPIVIWLSWPFTFLHASHVWHFWLVTTRESIASSSRENALECTHLINSSHSHTQSLHYSHLNTGLLIAKLQTNLLRNKANTLLNKFNLIVCYLFFIHKFIFYI